MEKKLFKNLILFTVLLIGFSLWAYWIVNNHSQDAIVSWDEGFHGGAALFISESLSDHFAFQKYSYILNDFKNGIIWYPPLWLFVAGPLGAIFGPSVEIYRFSTLIFSILSILLIQLFIKSLTGIRASLIAAIILAFSPIFLVYSHLMMREVPNLFGITLPLVLFYKYLTTAKPGPKLLLFTAFAFAIGVLAKVISIVIIFATILCFGIILYLFYRKDLLWQRFYSRWSIYFLIIGLLTFNIFRIFTQKVLHADLLFFHLEQTKQLSGDQGNFLIVTIRNIFENFTFYFRDFLHMPILTVFWFGSFLSYFIVRKSLLSIFLMVWLVVIYIAFSAVKPQATQYLLPIFAPLSIGVGLFWNEVLLSIRKYQSAVCVVLIISIIYLELLHLDRTETIVWKSLITNQYQAAAFVAQHAKYGDRVISSGDGTRFLIRLLGSDKRLQTINGAAKICPAAIQDSIEWAILDFGPQNPLRLEGISPPNWIQMSSFSGEVEPIYVYKNKRNTKKLVIVGDGSKNPCARFLLPGENQIIIFATPLIKRDIDSSKADLRINLQVNPLKVVNSIVISQEQISSQSGIAQRYELAFNQQRINQPIYFYFGIPDNVELRVNRIEVTNLEGR